MRKNTVEFCDAISTGMYSYKNVLASKYDKNILFGMSSNKLTCLRYNLAHAHYAQTSLLLCIVHNNIMLCCDLRVTVKDSKMKIIHCQHFLDVIDDVRFGHAMDKNTDYKFFRKQFVLL